jgi:16S rRNA (uracil1498-N3)-methyltransferase
MRLHRFYIGNIIDEPIKSGSLLNIDSPSLYDQLRKVFRLKNGDHIIAFDGSGYDYECELISGEHHKKGELTLRVLSATKSQYIGDRNITLFVAVPKKDTLEWIVEKATELGISNIVPIISERTEKKAINRERLEKIIIEASEQSGRGDIPKLGALELLEKALNKSKSDQSIVFHTVGDILFENDEDKETINNKDLSIFIGPEGGWSEDEIDKFRKSGFIIRKLGEQILRTETATIATLSLVLFSE